jgi:hypothetical protein
MSTEKSKWETGFPFEPIEHYERLKLRETSPDTFMLRAG